MLRGLNVLGGLRLDEVKGFACGVEVFLQNPMLDLRAAIGELDPEELIFDGGDGLDGGCDLRRGAGRLRGGCGSGRLALRDLSCRRGRLGLSGGGRLIFRLGLGEEVLIAEEGGEYKEHEGHGGAHITTTAAAGTLRLQIGIVNFGQRKLPIVCRGQPAGQPLYLW